jgi:hypothetical protein
MIKRTFGCVALLGLMASGLLQAHHSLAGVYDMKTEKEMAGTVSKVQFTNPHGSLSINVKNEDGTETEWVFTLGSVSALAQRGVGKIGPNALHVGDAIKVKYIPAKDGHPLGFLKTVIYPDGHEVVVSGGGPND